mmetsp:Transcript_87188/g.188807  ORF Transcript_87188/g.188807 Transcript_87188/m.188807 type:complete len:290 (+) Transcript_87188:153-1022(+)
MVVWLEFMSISFVELALEFNPMESEGVEETLQTVHAHEHSNGHTHEDDEAESDHEEVGAERGFEQLVEEDQRELRVREREGPQSQLGGRVAHAAQREFDGFDHLVHEQLAEGMGVFVFNEGVDATQSLEFGVFGAAEQDGFSQQHNRHAEQGYYQHCALDAGLGVHVEHCGVGVRRPHLEHQVDHGCNQIFLAGVGALHCPLDDDHGVHPTEQQGQEEQLRNEFEEQVHPLALEHVVAALEHHAERHLHHADQHSQLHLLTVEESDFLVAFAPHGVEPEGLGAVGSLNK